MNKTIRLKDIIKGIEAGTFKINTRGHRINPIIDTLKYEYEHVQKRINTLTEERKQGKDIKDYRFDILNDRLNPELRDLISNQDMVYSYMPINDIKVYNKVWLKISKLLKPGAFFIDLYTTLTFLKNNKKFIQISEGIYKKL